MRIANFNSLAGYKVYYMAENTSGTAKKMFSFIENNFNLF